MSPTEPTQILPIVKQRPTASPLLLGAGGVALAMVVGVGGWALLGSSSGGDPLVFPWSADKPGPIDVSVSMVPTVEPTPSPEELSPSPSATRPRTPKRTSPTPITSASPPVLVASPVPTRSTEALTGQLTAVVVENRGWNGYRLISVTVRNPGSAAVATWTVELAFDKDMNPGDPWNGRMDESDPRRLRITAERSLGAGDTVQFGFIASYGGTREPRLVTCQVDGRGFPCSAQ